MDKMLDLEVIPEQGLQTEQWEFLLGMHFSQSVAIIQSQVTVIKSAHVIYNDQTPLAHDLILDLPLDGIRLIYDSNSQRLKLIEVNNLKLVRLKYCGTVFNGPDVIPTVDQIDRCFGATRPGVYDKQRQLFALHFRGLSFYFPVDLQYEPGRSHGLGSLRFPGDSSPVLAKMIIYCGNNATEAPVPQLPLSCYRGHVYCEDCHVLRNANGTKTLGLRLKLVACSSNILEPTRVQFERELCFGDSAQTVASKLGTPSRVFYKAEDKMKIHSRDYHKRVSSERSDYFFNYFTMGLDVLFDAVTHRAIKMILHSNFPGHYDFNSYHRCPFSLSIGRQPGTATISSLSTAMGKAQISAYSAAPQPSLTAGGGSNNNMGGGGQQQNQGKNKNQNNKSKGKKNKGNNSIIQNQDLQTGPNNAGASDETSPETSPTSGSPPSGTTAVVPQHSGDKNWISVKFNSCWKSVTEFFGGDQGCSIEKPVVLTRSSSNNPFGSCLCYGVQDMIFEVMANDHIASVTIYQAEPPVGIGAGAPPVVSY
ncbi:hypothetical protein Ocin01_03102 [Orchesella cincta]|uniref:Uncharacterized protein n=1 Tax=Orchesella cincta TaxID=48709 RepID=A0A1D2NF21_ORCCI|nr:hypothetical protein Ocin01_03102 [Orchesella cincta]